MKLLESILSAFIQFYMSADESFMDIMSADENCEGEQTNVVFLCWSRCINLRRPGREDDLSAAAGREEHWNVEVTFEVYEPAAAAFAKCSAPYHPSIRLQLTQCPTDL